MKIWVNYTINLPKEVVEVLKAEHGIKNREDLKLWLQFNGTVGLSKLDPTGFFATQVKELFQENPYLVIFPVEGGE